jgi:hypothetical protein
MLCRFDPGSGYIAVWVPCPTDCVSGQAVSPTPGTEKALQIIINEGLLIYKDTNWIQKVEITKLKINRSIDYQQNRDKTY